MRVLVDTNILLRYADPDDPHYDTVHNAVERLFGQGHDLGFTPQAIREAWNVLTRPRTANGLGLETQQAERLVVGLEAAFAFWDDIPGIFAEWRRLVVSLEVLGVQTHDANHAAAALVHGATHVLTLDRKDFARYRRYGLEPIRPEDVIAG